ncbi:Hypothetical predicted protein, partial [Podarcis lilfordi]
MLWKVAETPLARTNHYDLDNYKAKKFHLCNIMESLGDEGQTQSWRETYLQKVTDVAPKFE